jgi:hypothetical protein
MADDDKEIDFPVEADAAPVEAIDVDRLIEESGLAGFDAAAAASLAAQLGLTDKQRKLGIAILQGRNQIEAAKLAGFAGNDATIRSAGSKAANSKKVRRFLEAARAAMANKPVKEMTNEEKRSLLSRIARESSDAVRVRAILGHSQLEREDRELEASEAGGDDPISILVEIGELDDECFIIALGLARKHNLADQFEGAWQKHLQRAAPLVANGGTQAGAA